MSEDQAPNPTHVVELDPTPEAATEPQAPTEPVADAPSALTAETLMQATDLLNSNAVVGDMTLEVDAPAEPQVTLTKTELRQIIASEVRAATASAAPRQAVNIKGMALVRVWGSYIEALNQHVSQINNFNVEVVMPASYTMGDLRRSLPRKLAKTIPSFKRLREVKGHEIMGPALPSDAIDYIAPINQPITSHIDAINAAEGVEADDDAQGGGAALDTSELDPATGLPRVIND